VGGWVGGAHLFFGAPPPRLNVREGKLGVTPTVGKKAVAEERVEHAPRRHGLARFGPHVGAARGQ